MRRSGPAELSENLTVRTQHGPVRGRRERGLRVWRGVRYGAPPTGALRFRAPVEPEPWSEPAECAEFGPICPQAPGMPMEAGAVQDEDCLNLNVWSPGGDGGPGRGRGHPRQPGATRAALGVAAQGA